VYEKKLEMKCTVNDKNAAQMVSDGAFSSHFDNDEGTEGLKLRLEKECAEVKELKEVLIVMLKR
jgi:hypothetical protein